MERAITLGLHLGLLLTFIIITVLAPYIIFGIFASIIIAKWLENEPILKPFLKKVKHYVKRIN